LLDAARNLDLAVERYKLARPALEQAVRAWREAVAEATSVDALTAAPSNGKATLAEPLADPDAVVTKGNRKAPFPGPFLERTTGIEPATLSLGS
jgi:hypothetical protein